MEMLIGVDKEEISSLAAVAAVLPAADSLLTVWRQVVLAILPLIMTKLDLPHQRLPLNANSRLPGQMESASSWLAPAGRGIAAPWLGHFRAAVGCCAGCGDSDRLALDRADLGDNQVRCISPVLVAASRRLVAA